jgi:hypothetical protein
MRAGFGPHDRCRGAGLPDRVPDRPHATALRGRKEIDTQRATVTVHGALATAASDTDPSSGE